MILPALYHWSPTSRREAILRDGLRMDADATVCSGDPIGHPFRCICLSPSPSAAWSLSGAMEWCQEIEAWDLWQVRLADGDEVHIRPDFGPVIQEIKVRTPIPADRLWWVGERAA